LNGPPSPVSLKATEEVTNELFRLLVQSVKDYAIFLLDASGHVASWNEGAQRIKGYTEAEIVGKHFSVFYPQSVKDSGWPDYELKTAAAEGRFEDEGWRVRNDGSMFWADVVITALRDESGTLVGFAKVTRDLTERRSAEEELRQSEERYRLLVDTVQDYAIFMLDPNGYVMTWNSGAERLKGYKAEEIVGQHFSKFYPPERAAEGFPEQELQIARSEGRFEEENWRVRKDGTCFWANVVLTAVYNKNGELQGFSKVTRDITDRRYLTDQLNERVAELAETNRTLGEKNREVETFVYSVSHDVRGPLVNLQGFNREIQRSSAELLSVLESDPAVPAGVLTRARHIISGDMRESSAFMENAVAHLGRIVDALLRLSRLGRVEYEYSFTNVSEIVKSVVRSLQGTIQEKGAQIIVKDLPSVWADPSAIEQIFANLISNALRYSDPTRRPRIEIGGSSDPAEGLARYYVKDNGLGIPEHAIRDVFTAFRRFHPEAGPGEGMGLVMVRRVVERHNGKIRVESKVGQGTLFSLEFPNTVRNP